MSEVPAIFHRIAPTAVTRPPVTMQWKCQQSGDCCTKPGEVVMTVDEAKGIGRYLALHDLQISLQIRAIGEGFISLKAGPCPLYDKNTCLVYDVRPYNCRRFACMRPDPATEPWAFTPTGDCANLWDRIRTSRVARRLGTLIQRRAQKWAAANGWDVT